VDGWFRTDDLAERSPDGYYTLRGRRSDLIISGGFNLYPREIEELLLELPGVNEVAVCGVPSAFGSLGIRGDKPKMMWFKPNPNIMDGRSPRESQKRHSFYSISTD
jgi:acyl-CoA synthetase (AMP-forming)/AMP-acid ligase II